MKIKNGYILKNIAGEFVVIPVASEQQNSLISLNETGAFIWERLEKQLSKTEIISEMCNEYDVSNEKAEADFDIFVNKMKEISVLE